MSNCYQFLFFGNKIILEHKYYVYFYLYIRLIAFFFNLLFYLFKKIFVFQHFLNILLNNCSKSYDHPSFWAQNDQLTLKNFFSFFSEPLTYPLQNFFKKSIEWIQSSEDKSFSESKWLTDDLKRNLKKKMMFLIYLLPSFIKQIMKEILKIVIKKNILQNFTPKSLCPHHLKQWTEFLVELQRALYQNITYRVPRDVLWIHHYFITHK